MAKRVPFAALTVLSLALLPARIPGAPQPGTAVAPPRSAAVSGLITDGATGRGLSAVVVSLTGGSVRVSLATVTDSKGRFAFIDLPASDQYYLSASRSGYLAGGLARRNTILPTPFSLAEGEWISDANVVMWRPGGIGGTVLDEKGEPVVNVPVRVLTRVPIAGTSQWATGAVARTDDRGFYRISGLFPGAYIVTVPSVQSVVPLDSSPASVLGLAPGAARGTLPAVAGVEVDDVWVVVGQYATPPPDHRQAYPTLFYPGSTTMRDAMPVELGASEERRNIDFVLRPVPTARVSGRVVGPSAVIRDLVVRLLHVGAEAMGSGSEQATARVGAGGVFAFIGVPAGRYLLDARTGFSELNTASTAALPVTPGLVSQQYVELLPWLPDALNTSLRTRYIGVDGGYAARMPISVGSGDVSDIVVTLERGATISGRIVRDDGAPLPKAVTAKVEPANGDPDLGGAVPDQVSPAGTFVVRGIWQGEYFLRVSAGNLRVKSILGPGGDYTNRPFETVLGQDVTDVVVTVTDQTASVSGVVHDRRGATVREGAVILFPTDRSRWPRFGREPADIRGINYFGNRGYEIQGLPAGDYFIIAVDLAMRDAWQDPRFFVNAAPVATRITLGWGGTVARDLTLQQVVLR